MTTPLIAFFLSVFISYSVTILVIKFATKRAILDDVGNYRKIHSVPVPRLGGIGIFVAFMIPMVILTFFHRNLASAAFKDIYYSETIGIFIGATVAFLMGLYDDIKDLSAKGKLFFQFIAGAIACYFSLIISEVYLPFLGNIHLGIWSIPITILWFMVCMNAVNLLDGLDGLAAGVGLLVSITILLMSLIFENTPNMILAACLSGALLGFLYHNFYPAKIYMGDSGSMCLGFLLASLGIWGSRNTETSVSLLIPVIALGLPILDTSLAIIRRLSKKLPVSMPDRMHIHHKLLTMGLSHRRTVLIMYGMCIVLGVLALLLTLEKNELTIIILGSLTIIVFISVRLFGELRVNKLMSSLSENIKENKNNSDTRVALEVLSHQLDTAKDIEEVWSSCGRIWEKLKLDKAILFIGAHPSTKADSYHWDSEPHELSSSINNIEQDKWNCKLNLRSANIVYGSIELTKSINRGELLSVTPEIASSIRDKIEPVILKLSKETQISTEAV